MKSAIITGAGGFIGGYVVKEFVESGWHVVCVVHHRIPTYLQSLADAGKVSLIKADLTARGSFAAAVAELGGRGNCDALVHCAAKVCDVGREEHYRNINYDAVRELAFWCADKGRCRFVFVSTTDVYGFIDGQGAAEDELTYPEGRLNPYQKYKILSEKAIKRILPDDRWVIIRPGSVWGSGDRLVGPRIVRFLESSPLIVCFGRYHGRNRWPLSHVRNVAAAIRLSAEDSQITGKAVTVVDSERSDVKDVFQMFASIYLPGKKLRSLSLPCWLFLPISSMNVWTCRLLDRHKPLFDPTTYTLRLSSANRDYSNERFRRLLDRHGRNPVTMEEGMRDLRFSEDLSSTELQLRRTAPH
jgi:nucleoside-diphosphate-sugar epimerase